MWRYHLHGFTRPKRCQPRQLHHFKSVFGFELDKEANETTFFFLLDEEAVQGRCPSHETSNVLRLEKARTHRIQRSILKLNNPNGIVRFLQLRTQNSAKSLTKTHTKKNKTITTGNENTHTHTNNNKKKRKKKTQKQLVAVLTRETWRLNRRPRQQVTN